VWLTRVERGRDGAVAEKDIRKNRIRKYNDV